MTHILGLCRRKQSCKNTAFNFLLALDLLKLSIVRTTAEITTDGQLKVGDIFGDESRAGIFDIDRNSPVMKKFREENIYHFIRNYSFADLLKQSVCIDLLGLDWEHCYGTDKQKMSKTHLLWENMPGVTTEVTPDNPIEEEVAGRLGEYYKKVLSGVGYHEQGPTNGRDVMQFVGTEVFRKMYGNVWSDGTIKRIQKNEGRMAVITDCRFPNEVEAIQKAGGKVIRLTRNTYPEDNHVSETALDKENYDWKNFDCIIDNENLSISESNGLIYNALREWDWIYEVNLPREQNDNNIS